MTAIPLMIDLDGKRVIVVGGGAVAERRIRALLESGAHLTVISPDVTEAIYTLWQEGAVDWRQKRVSGGDLSDAFLIVTAANDLEVNQFVAARAPANALINNASDAERGNTQFPSFFNRGRLSLSVSTNGASPMLTANIKRDLEAQFDKRWTGYVDFLYECRQLLKRIRLPENEQRLILQQILSENYYHHANRQIMLNWLANEPEGEDAQ
ncbi:precorrin-2 dehydrogenase / sirohydrochlorin ferrochelatase [Lentibacillus persicus]|uniref:precorrin-2 dehydrogenase n=1 Tax=Lentibacillus persicus TaxID=640948 RepID=A0A1I1W935_9BACI|nr:NAD(P)-binding protein [Lentibacillus persicus]SFD89913.1 precorrin-2 dehydrogenase / sirohydrochlorin ferrochelatase [Lentibacillus persicus]